MGGGVSAQAFLLPLIVGISVLAFVLTAVISLSPTEAEIRADADLMARISGGRPADAAMPAQAPGMPARGPRVPQDPRLPAEQEPASGRWFRSGSLSSLAP
jgi:hypothetical protein